MEKKEQKIIVAPKGCLDKSAKDKISKNGHILIECDEPEKVRLLMPTENLSSGDMLMSAMRAICKTAHEGPKNIFIDELYRRMLLNEQTENTSPITPKP